MNKVEKEIRDLLETNLNTVHAAQVGTTVTNVTITAHGLSTGDYVINTTRSSAALRIVVVDANNFTTPTVTGQTTGDSITFLRFKKYYVGEIDTISTNYLPCVTVYGRETRLVRLTTSRDKWEYDVFIEVYTNAFGKVSETEPLDNIMQAQAELKTLMEERDENGAALDTTILGILRRNILGVNYLYSNEISIRYEKKAVQDRTYFKATMELKAVSKFSPRS